MGTRARPTGVGAAVSSSLVNESARCGDPVPAVL